jgi:hypothetical protein
MATFTVTFKGIDHSFESAFTDIEAIAICATGDDNLGKKLASDFNYNRLARPDSNHVSLLSPRQWAWVHRIAGQIASARAAEKAAGQAVEAIGDDGDMDRIVKMMAGAKTSKLLFPKIRLIDENSKTEYLLDLYGQYHRYAGHVRVAVRHGGIIGRIATDGLFFPEGNALTRYPGLVAVMASFAADPVKAAQSYARLTGRCPFCRNHLTDMRSTKVGFGEICSRRFGLHQVWLGKVELADVLEVA